MRFTGRSLVLAGALCAAGLATRPLGAQDHAVRFDVDSVGDSTFTFRTRGHSWVKPGRRGSAVDPRRRDVLVARFEVLGVGDSIATALLTGVATPLTTEHVVLLAEPARPWFRERRFWFGALTGALVGALGGATLR